MNQFLPLIFHINFKSAMIDDIPETTEQLANEEWTQIEAGSRYLSKQSSVSPISCFSQRNEQLVRNIALSVRIKKKRFEFPNRSSQHFSSLLTRAGLPSYFFEFSKSVADWELNIEFHIGKKKRPSYCFQGLLEQYCAW